MRYGDLTYEEILERATQDWLAIVPTGCTEQQGPHLPVDFDTWFVEQACNTASEQAFRDYRVHSLVLPAITVRAHAGASKLRGRIHRHPGRPARLSGLLDPD